MRRILVLVPFVVGVLVISACVSPQLSPDTRGGTPISPVTLAARPSSTPAASLTGTAPLTPAAPATETAGPVVGRLTPPAENLCPAPKECKIPGWNLYNEGEVLFTGPQAELDKLIQFLQERNSELFAQQKERTVIDLSGFVPNRDNLKRLGLPTSWDGQLQIRRMTLADSKQAGNFLKSLPSLLKELGIIDVIVEPNFATAHGEWTIEGSPWTIEGSPWTIEGSGSGLPSGTGERHYWKQWALGGSTGIGPGRSFPLGAAGDLPVTVAIFDTAPQIKGGYRDVKSGLVNVNIDWVRPPFVLHVKYNRINVRPPSPECAPVVSDHGLFVAGLVHAVVARPAGGPQPKISTQLIEVLDRNGRGDIYTLVEQLVQFANGRRAEQKDLSRTVINLSLGSPNPKDTELPVNALEYFLGSSGYRPAPGVIEERERTIVTLDTVMRFLNADGALIVAAAGNGSALRPANPLPAEIPAAYCPHVIGVAAGNRRQGLACFSNTAAFAAPGGDGRLTSPTSQCLPAICTCDPERAAECPYGVISLITGAAEGVSGKGYALWSGSSFSAPLASGSLALALTRGASMPKWTDTGGQCPSPSAPGPFKGVTAP